MSGTRGLTVLGVCGSLRKGSYNMAALREAQLTIYRHPELIPDLAGERGTERVKPAAAAKTAEPGATRAETKLWAAFVLSGVGR